MKKERKKRKKEKMRNEEEHRGMIKHSKKVEIAPHHLKKIIKIPVVVSRDGAAVRSAREDIKSLDGDLIDLVEDIDAGDVDTVAFNDINQIISCSITVEVEISITNLNWMKKE